MATTVRITNLLASSSSPLLASGDILPFVDVSDTAQSPQGSTVKITLTNFFANVPVPIVVTSATTPQLKLAYDGTHSCTLSVSSAGALTINATSTVTITPATTITGALTCSSTILGTNITASSQFISTVFGTGSSGTPLELRAGASAVGTFSASLATFPGGISATTGAFSGAINSQTISSAANFTGSVTVASGFTVSAGTAAVQAFTATNGTFTDDTHVVTAKKLAVNAGLTTYLIDATGEMQCFSGSIKAWASSAGDFRTFGQTVLAGSGSGLGFYGSAGTTQLTVTGSRGGNAALASLLAALASLNLIVNSSSA